MGALNQLPYDVEDLKREMEKPHEDFSWFCAGTMVNFKTGEILVVDYYPDYKKEPGQAQTKFPGGKGKHENGREDKTPADTLRAEIADEVLAKEGVVKGFYAFHKIVLPGREGKTPHVKYCAIMELEGDLRTEDFYEAEETDERGRITNEKLGPPRFVLVADLAKNMFRGHKPFLLALCMLLAHRHEEFGWAAAKLERDGILL